MSPAALNRDSRGLLGVVEFSILPIEVRRFFWICEVTDGSTRAGHGHYRTTQVLLCLQGSVCAAITGKEGNGRNVILTPGDIEVVEPRKWLVLSEFAKGTVLGVFADLPYDANDYINDVQYL